MAFWYSESVSECRLHLSEKPHPGVCPSCLRERLSRIAAVGNISHTIDFSNSSDSASCSFSSSPSRIFSNFRQSSGSSSRRWPHNRTASDIFDSIYIALSGIRCNSTTGYGNVLRKSRSIAAAPRINGNEGSGMNIKNQNQNQKNKKKMKMNMKGGFWSKLLCRSIKKAKF